MWDFFLALQSLRSYTKRAAIKKRVFVAILWAKKPQAKVCVRNLSRAITSLTPIQSKAGSRHLGTKVPVAAIRCRPSKQEFQRQRDHKIAAHVQSAAWRHLCAVCCFGEWRSFLGLCHCNLQLLQTRARTKRRSQRAGRRLIIICDIITHHRPNRLSEIRLSFEVILWFFF